MVILGGVQQELDSRGILPARSDDRLEVDTCSSGLESLPGRKARLRPPDYERCCKLLASLELFCSGRISNRQHCGQLEVEFGNGEGSMHNI